MLKPMALVNGHYECRSLKQRPKLSTRVMNVVFSRLRVRSNYIFTVVSES